MAKSTTERRTLEQDKAAVDLSAEAGAAEVSPSAPADMSQYHPHTQAVIEAVAGVIFPTTPAALIEAARNSGAPDLIIQRLGNLSADLYPNLDSVTESVGL